MAGKLLPGLHGGFMSHDSWGGGSDADPKLRVKELACIEQRESSKPSRGQRDRWAWRLQNAHLYHHARPRFPLFDGLLLLTAPVAALVVAGRFFYIWVPSPLGVQATG